MLGRYRKDVLGRYIQVLSQIFEEFLRKNLEISLIVCIHLIKSKLNILKSLLVYPHQPDSQGNSKIGILIISPLMVIFWGARRYFDSYLERQVFGHDLQFQWSF